MTSFTHLGVPARLAAVLTELGFDTPTPIQRATLPDALAGRDVLGRGRTGSGKTLAFLLPLVARLSGPGRTKPRSGAPRAMILAPTRELVAQIDAALQPLAKAAGLTSRTVFGGVGQGAQVAAIRRGTDILVACPGRLEDLIEQRHCSLSDVEISVLDEADHMADLGFLPAVRRLLAGTPADGQRMLFSATLDRAVDALVRQFLVDPQVHQADSAQSPVSTMTHHVLQVSRENRLPILVDLTSAPGRTVVFTRTKHGAKGLARKLNRSGVPAVELHGNLNQNARTRNLDAFHSGRATTLVATDIAARGIHVDHVALVIHADPPVDPKAYLHRSGRTARAGNSGSVITLATPDQAQEVRQLTKSAGITPTTTKINSDRHAVLTELAPGPRVLQPSADAPAALNGSAEEQPDGRSAEVRPDGRSAGTGNGRNRRRGGGRGRAGRTGSAAEREAEFGANGRETAERGPRTADRESKIAGRGGRAASREGQVAERGSKIAGREGQAAERGSKIAGREGRTAERRSEIAGREGRTAERGSEIAGRESKAVGRESKAGRDSRPSERGSRAAEPTQREGRGSSRPAGGSRGRRRRRSPSSTSPAATPSHSSAAPSNHGPAASPTHSAAAFSARRR